MEFEYEHAVWLEGLQGESVASPPKSQGKNDKNFGDSKNGENYMIIATYEKGYDTLRTFVGIDPIMTDL